CPPQAVSSAARMIRTTLRSMRASSVLIVSTAESRRSDHKKTGTGPVFSSFIPLASETGLATRPAVQLDAGQHFLAGGFHALPAVDLHPFALFQVLVVGEEV